MINSINYSDLFVGGFTLPDGCANLISQTTEIESLFISQDQKQSLFEKALSLSHFLSVEEKTNEVGAGMIGMISNLEDLTEILNGEIEGTIDNLDALMAELAASLTSKGMVGESVTIYQYCGVPLMMTSQINYEGTAVTQLAVYLHTKPFNEALASSEISGYIYIKGRDPELDKVGKGVAFELPGTGDIKEYVSFTTDELSMRAREASTSIAALRILLSEIKSHGTTSTSVIITKLNTLDQTEFVIDLKQTLAQYKTLNYASGIQIAVTFLSRSQANNDDMSEDNPTWVPLDRPAYVTSFFSVLANALPQLLVVVGAVLGAIMGAIGWLIGGVLSIVGYVWNALTTGGTSTQAKFAEAASSDPTAIAGIWNYPMTEGYATGTRIVSNIYTRGRGVIGSLSDNGVAVLSPSVFKGGSPFYQTLWFSGIPDKHDPVDPEYIEWSCHVLNQILYGGLNLPEGFEGCWMADVVDSDGLYIRNGTDYLGHSIFGNVVKVLSRTPGGTYDASSWTTAVSDPLRLTKNLAALSAWGLSRAVARHMINIGRPQVEGTTWTGEILVQCSSAYDVGFGTPQGFLNYLENADRDPVTYPELNNAPVNLWAALYRACCSHVSGNNWQPVKITDLDANPGIAPDLSVNVEWTHEQVVELFNNPIFVKALKQMAYQPLELSTGKVFFAGKNSNDPDHFDQTWKLYPDEYHLHEPFPFQDPALEWPSVSKNAVFKAMAVMAGLAAVVLAAKSSVKSFLRRRALKKVEMRKAAVSSAQERWKQDPTSENLRAYEKASRKYSKAMTTAANAGCGFVGTTPVPGGYATATTWVEAVENATLNADAAEPSVYANDPTAAFDQQRSLSANTYRVITGQFPPDVTPD